jgi:hypothetical protein
MLRNVVRLANLKNAQNLVNYQRNLNLVCIRNFHRNRRGENGEKRRSSKEFSPLICASVFSVFNIFKRENPEEESELVMTIKRSILCMQRQEFDKAERVR